MAMHILFKQPIPHQTILCQARLWPEQQHGEPRRAHSTGVLEES